MIKEHTPWNTDVHELDEGTNRGYAESTVRCSQCHKYLEAAEAYFSRYAGEAICEQCHYFEEDETSGYSE